MLGAPLTATVAFLCTITLFIHPASGEYAVRDGDTVVFLGDSITAERTYGKLIENYTLLRFPDRRVRFVNVGIGGDTAEGGWKRLGRDVFAHNATLLTVAYGINDIGWGTTADAEHRQTYLDSIRKIVETCVARGVRVYICSAAVTSADPFESHDTFLQRMCDDGMTISREHGGKSIDVQRSMREIQKHVWNWNAGKPKEQHCSLHAKDGIHLSELGQLAMAYAILKGLDATKEVSTATIVAVDNLRADSEGCSITELRRDKAGIQFTRTDSSLPFNYGIFFSLHYRFVPLSEELNRYMLRVTDLPNGSYQVLANERNLGVFQSSQLARGVNISSATGNAWHAGGPWDVQATVLKSLTDARHHTDVASRLAGSQLSGFQGAVAAIKHTHAVDGQLQHMQRLVAAPQPYRFLVKPAVSVQGDPPK